MTVHKSSGKNVTEKKRGAVIELEDLTSDFKIHKNLTQDVIMTTQDKLRLAIIEHRDVLASRKEWISAGSLSLSLLTSLTLTQFQDRLGLPADTWRALYGCFFFLSLLWLINSLYKLYQNRKRGDVDYLIKQIKKVGEQDGGDD
jgi:hypothetical protein